MELVGRGRGRFLQGTERCRGWVGVSVCVERFDVGRSVMGCDDWKFVIGEYASAQMQSPSHLRETISPPSELEVDGRTSR